MTDSLEVGWELAIGCEGQNEFEVGGPESNAE